VCRGTLLVRLTRSDGRIIVEPNLRPEWIPEGTWRALGLRRGRPRGAQVVEVVDYLDPVLRKIDRVTEGDNVTGSSSIGDELVASLMRITVALGT
jgi:hypothetical protein